MTNTATSPAGPLTAEQPPTAQIPELPQYSLRRIIGTWAAAALPMGVLAWVVAPWMANNVFEGPTAMSKSLILALMAGLV